MALKIFPASVQSHVTSCKRAEIIRLRYKLNWGGMGGVIRWYDLQLVTMSTYGKDVT